MTTLSLRRAAVQTARQWLSGLLSVSVILSPLGCRVQVADFGDGGLLGGLLGGSSSDAGLFLNQDETSPLLMAGRDNAGDVFYVFGTRNSSGDLEEIEAVSVTTPEGDESFIAFESGRPTHVEGPNGSYAHATYNETSAQRLAADIELYNAGDDSKQQFEVDIDLEQTAQQVAAAVRDATGRTLETTEVPDEESAKSVANEQVRVTIFSPLFTGIVAPFIISIGLATIILGQMVIALVALVAAALQAVVLAIFSPLFLIADILSDVVFRVQLIPLTSLFIELPPPPIVILA